MASNIQMQFDNSLDRESACKSDKSNNYESSSNGSGSDSDSGSGSGS